MLFRAPPSSIIGARLLPVLALILLPEAAFAAELDGRALGFLWALPFAGILLSIALFPLLAPHAWEHHQGNTNGR